MKPIPLVVSAVLCLSLPVWAFGEDICYPKSGGGVVNCAPLPSSCSLTEPVSNQCLADALATLVEGAASSNGGRSLVHVDTTYIMARVLGFAHQDAYWIAAYDEATDLGTFRPRDVITGLELPDAGSTVDVGGITRANLDTGGSLFHFIAPRNGGAATPVPGIDGLHPQPDDAETEVLLAHVKTWALAATGTSAPLCTGGITVPSPAGDLATGGACYQQVPLEGAFAVFSGPAAQPYATTTGSQIISQADGGTVYATQFDQHVGGTAAQRADARLGIYLHALADRLTHHVCSDESVLAGPTDAGFDERFEGPECGQGLHALRHEYETGVPLDQVGAEDQTTLSLLPTLYAELIEFARARGVLKLSATGTQFRNQLFLDLKNALSTPDALLRVKRVTQVGCQRGVEPFPGTPACGP